MKDPTIYTQEEIQLLDIQSTFTSNTTRSSGGLILCHSVIKHYSSRLTNSDVSVPKIHLSVQTVSVLAKFDAVTSGSF